MPTLRLTPSVSTVAITRGAPSPGGFDWTMEDLSGVWTGPLHGLYGLHFQEVVARMGRADYAYAGPDPDSEGWTHLFQRTEYSLDTQDLAEMLARSLR